MKSLKKLITSTALVASMLLATSFSANAILIKQEIFDSFGLIGLIEVEVADEAIGTGILDSAFGDPVEVTKFDLGGLYPWGDNLNVLFSQVVIDSDNLERGIELFSIDADDVGFSPAATWSYQAFYDAAFDFGFLEVFTATGFDVFADEISLGAAVVNAPATVALFSLALGGLLVRRKRA
ncbi:PEP-CTERM sorting domain-containing protein [Ningiella sp. W23]|uniref:PEP-CTERM sorting domain-containing protein n=1 Tax=Ningiella sp. W23 TaxID=3023715 RepID=UPI0037570B13